MSLHFWALAALSFGALGFAPALAEAKCPTADSLTHGIFVKYDDESFSRITRYNETDTFEQLIYADGETFGYVMAGGVVTRQSFDMKGMHIIAKSVLDYQISGGDIVVADMEAGDDVFLDFTKLHAGGQTTGNYLVELGPPTEVALGNCSYDAQSVSVTMTEEGDETVTRLFWLPELGVSLLRQISDKNGSYPYQALAISDNFPYDRGNFGKE